MSFLALAGGVLFYVLLSRRDRIFAPTPLLSRWNAARIFDIVNVGLIRGAGGIARVLFLRACAPQLLLIFLVTLLAGSLPLFIAGFSQRPGAITPLDPLFAALWLGGAACAIGAAAQAKFHRLVALILVGGVGLMTCLTFAWFSAPDLALTQIAVEVVTLILILLGLRWLPKRLDVAELRRYSVGARVRRARDLALAIGAGTGMAALSYAVLTRPLDG